MSSRTDQMVLQTPEELQSCFEKRWTYPSRPMLLYKNYPFKLLHASNPDEFSIQVEDRTSTVIKGQIQEACQRYQRYVTSHAVAPVKNSYLKTLLPVTVEDNDGTYHRAEVNLVEVNRVNVYMVDLGADKWVPAHKIYPTSIDLLRFPKVSLMCRLAQVAPVGKVAKEWPEWDYESLFNGQKSSLFSISLIDRGMYEVYLECDEKDVGFEMVMNLGLADYIPLLFDDNDEEEKHVGMYPRSNYTDWIGQKISVFGTKVSKMGSNGHFKIHLQLDTCVMESVEALLEKAPMVDKNAKDFSKERGDAVVVRYGEDRAKYRATIFQKSRLGYLVKLVDYGDFVNVKEEDLLKISAELVAIQEAATPCYLAELVKALQCKSTLSDTLREQLTNLVVEKNLICRIGFANYMDAEDEREMRKCIVSLASEDEKPFQEILSLPKVNNFHYLTSYRHQFPTTSQYLAAKLLGADSAYFPGIKYEGIVSSVENHNSVWLQLSGDDARAEELSEELTKFYTYWRDCPQLDSNQLKMGSYVSSQQNVEGDFRYYRARIIEPCPTKNSYKVRFLDYGNDDVVSIEMMKPLPNYFCKDKCFALQVALPVELVSIEDSDKLYDFICVYTEDQEITVYLQHENGLNYAWIYCMGKSLAESLAKSKISPVTLKITARHLFE